MDKLEDYNDELDAIENVQGKTNSDLITIASMDFKFGETRSLQVLALPGGGALLLDGYKHKTIVTPIQIQE